MAEFYEVRGFGPETATAELDRCAVEEAGVLWSGGYGYALPVATSTITQAPEWGTRVVNRQGMGNHGKIVLVGKTPRARALLREGKTRRLVAEGVPEPVARVACSCHYGMEPAVATLAGLLIPAVEARGVFEGNSHRAFAFWAGSAGDGAEPLSFPRKLAAAQIAAKLVEAGVSPPSRPTPLEGYDSMQEALRKAGLL